MLEDKNYPAQLSIKYNNKSNRVTVFFRLFLVLPILIIFILLLGLLVQDNDSNAVQIGGGFLFFPIMLMIVFRQKYPKWWFDWVYELTKFVNRVSAYMMLLTDKYPSTDEEQDVEVSLEYPNVKEDLNRYLPLIKWLLAIPHLLIMIIFLVLWLLLSPIVWLIVLIMGKMPEKLFNFLVGFLRYVLRVGAYSILLITDKYPSFNWEE
jgi:hypothetical protein